MRKADLRKNHDDLDAALSRYRAFMEKVVGAQRVVSTAIEKRDLAESAVLRLCAWWEYFVDEHLVDCVNCDSSMLSTFFGLDIPPHPSKSLCQALLFGDKYSDFRSFGDLKGFSKKVLVAAANPFLAVSKKHAEVIDQTYTIRNYLSHYSFKARRSLMALYKKEYNMTRFLEPGQFLLGYEGKRLWAIFEAFQCASADMKASY